MILSSLFNTHSHIHTQSLVYILREYLQKREETVIEWFREERASRGNHGRIEDGDEESGGAESGGQESGGQDQRRSLVSSRRRSPPSSSHTRKRRMPSPLKRRTY